METELGAPHKVVGRGYLAGLAGQAWHLLTAFALYALLARTLGPVAFGDWRLALSVLTWFEIAVTSGIAESVARSISREPAAAPAMGRAAYLSQLALGLVVFSAMQFVAGPVAVAIGSAALEPLIRLAALDIPLFALLISASAYLLGTERYTRQAVGWIVYATAKAALIAGLVLGGFSVAGALVGNALSSVAGLAALAVPLPRASSDRADVPGLARGLLRAAVPFLGLALMAGFNLTSDLWVVSAMLGPKADVGFYASAAVLAEIPVFLFIGLNRVVFPKIARAQSSGDIAARDQGTVLGLRIALVVSVMGISAAAFGGGPLLAAVFSPPYAAAATPLAWLMVAAAGRTVLSVACQVLMAQGRMRLALGATIATGVVQVARAVALVPRLGTTGAALGAAVASVAGAVAVLLGMRAAISTRPLITLARSGTVTAIASSPLALVHGAPALTLAAFALSSVVYLALLIVTKEVTREDFAALGLKISLGATRRNREAA
jgi:O-antigen/teichoic acid export membrane protein